MKVKYKIILGDSRMGKDLKFIKNQIIIAQIRAIGSVILGLMVLFGGLYIVNLYETEDEKITVIIATIALFFLFIIAFYSNIRAIKKYKSFLE